jgi:hypothetical protein
MPFCLFWAPLCPLSLEQCPSCCEQQPEPTVPLTPVSCGPSNSCRLLSCEHLPQHLSPLAGCIPLVFEAWAQKTVAGTQKTLNNCLWEEDRERQAEGQGPRP